MEEQLVAAMVEYIIHVSEANSRTTLRLAEDIPWMGRLVVVPSHPSVRVGALLLIYRKTHYTQIGGFVLGYHPIQVDGQQILLSSR